MKISLGAFADRKKKGFTLLEIVIVASILALLAALSYTLAMNAFITSNESAAQSALETLRTAMEQYRTINLTYSPDLATLGQGPLPYIDSVLASGTRRGYAYTVSNVTRDTFTITATPLQANITGRRTFRLDQSGEITEV